MQPGEVVAGRFRLERLAGQGGMGAVFRAHDDATGDVVAVKLTFGRDHELARRLQSEAEALAPIDDPKIVGYVDHGRDASLSYLALEWLDGEDLDRRLMRQPASVAESLTIVRGVAEALTALHARPLVHADIKPSNLFLMRSEVGDLKLIDFGAAFSPGQAGDAVMGTPHYLAPEQAAGGGLLDERTDLYSLGCVLYECLTGDVPFGGSTLFELLRNILAEPPPSPSTRRPGIPPAVERLCLALLQKEPDDRPASATMVLEWLAAVERETTLSTRRPEPARRRAKTLMGDERRLVSVLVLRAHVDDEVSDRTVALPDLGELADRVVEIAAAHGARAEAVGGASFMIVADAGAAPEARLARCALTLAELVPGASFGLATGLASVTGQWPLGEAIDVATVLAAKAGGAVRLDATTRKLLDERFDVASVDEGFVLQAYRPHAGGKDEGAPPLFGRVAELGHLRAMLDACRGQGRAQSLVITGAAGSGKSRLVRELLGEARGPMVCAGYGDALAPGAPYGVMKTALRRTLGLGERDGAPVREAALARRLAPLGLAGATATFLGVLLDLWPAPDGEIAARWAAAQREPVVMAGEVRRAVSDWLAAEIASHGGAIFVIEDLQWADSPSIQIVRHALDELAEERLMVIATQRQDPGSPPPEPWPGVGSLALTGLSQEAAAALVRAQLGPAADDAVISRVVMRAEGNPFFLAELARAAGSGQTTSPDTVLTIAQRRLDRLTADARRVLRAASVFGAAFWPQALVALVGPRVAGELDHLLDELVLAGIVERRPGLDLGGEPAWGFRHALLRDAAYSSLAAADRPIAHRLAAGWLGARRIDDPLTLAEHWRASDSPSEAAPWYLRAAQRALEGSDHDGAVALAERGLAAGATDELELELLLTVAESQMWHRGSTEARFDSAERVLALAVPGTAAWYRGFFHVLDAKAALVGTSRVREMVDLLLGLPAPPVATEDEVIALLRVAILCVRSGEADTAQLVEAKARARMAALPATIARVRGFRHRLEAWKALGQGDVVGAYQHDMATAEAFTAAAELRLACRARSDVGYEQMRLGLIEESRHSYEASLSVAERLGMRVTAAAARHNLGLVYAYLGRFDEALVTEEAARDEVDELDSPRHLVACYDYLSRIHLMRGDAVEAEAAAREELRATERWPEFEPLAHATLGRALTAQGRIEEALTESALSLTALDARGSVDGEQPYVAVGRLEALLAAGNHEEAASLHAWATAARDEQAARLGALREAFLTQVAENVALDAIGRRLAQGTTEEPESR